MKPATDTDGLTVRQRAILNAIRDSVATRGYPPSYRELAATVGLVSPSSVAYQLGELEALGWLRRDPDRPRALHVITPASVPCGACGGTGHVPAGAA